MANYLYNGVELPDINAVWTNKETYRHAYVYERILFVTQTKLILTGCPVVIARRQSTQQDVLDFEPTIAPYNLAQYTLRDGQWVMDREVEQPNYLGPDNNVAPIWCNTDLMWAGEYSYDTASDKPPTVSNEVCLAASDPVPAGKLPSFDPFSLTMGWMIGSRIAAQRGKTSVAAKEAT